MNTLSRTITGFVLIIIGIIMITLSWLTSFITLIYGIPLFLIGLFIIFNKKEDEIELRKDLNNKKSKK